MRTIVAVLLLTLLSHETVWAQAPADTAAIRGTVLDYVDGWWTGDVGRMERSLHPDLVKRIVVTHEVTGRSLLNSITRSDMVEYTRAGGGSAEIEQKGDVDVRIVSIEGGIADVIATSDRYVDYLHLARWNGRWLIVNVLWAPRSSDGDG
jgi:hypothetical protein